MTEHLVFNKTAEQKLALEEFLQVQWNEDVKVLLEKAGENPQLKAALLELLEKIILFTAETGEILDIAGQDNIILYLEEERWSFVLVDAQYPGNAKMMNSLKIILEKLLYGIEIEDLEKNVLLNSLNFIRTVNGMAEQLGSKARIHVSPDVTSLNVDFQSILNNCLSSK